MTIAVAHPGKPGDMLFSLPTAKALAAKHQTTVDFYTSTRCSPLIELLEYQSFIDRVIIPESYKIDNLGQGVQPWQMPVPEGKYEAIYQLGIRKWPETNMIDFYANIHNIGPAPYSIDCPEMPTMVSQDIIDAGMFLLTCSPIIPSEWYYDIVAYFSKKMPVIQLTGPGEKFIPGVTNTEVIPFLEVAAIMKQAKVYTGAKGVVTCMSIAFPNLKSFINLPGPGMDWRHNVERPHVTYLKEEPSNEWIRRIEEQL